MTLDEISRKGLTTNIKQKKFGFGDVLSGLTGLAGTIYNMWSNKRDFDYQKALQQQIFEREDTSIQRRVEDLKAAGLNPVLAAGSGANAGSIVARSNTNDVNMGAALDMLQHVQQLKQSKIETDYMKHQRDKAGYESNAMPYILDGQVKDAEMERDWVDYLNGKTYGMDPKLIEYFDYQWRNMKNSSDILNKENKWFTTNQVVSNAAKMVDSVTDFSKFGKFKNFGKIK